VLKEYHGRSTIKWTLNVKDTSRHNVAGDEVINEIPLKPKRLDDLLK
jgi:hypothetical protein